MTISYPPSRRWFENPRLLAVGAVCAAALALTGAAVGIATARTGGEPVPTPRPTGALSVVMQAPREPVQAANLAGRMETLDPVALHDQAVATASLDPEGDENLRQIDAQERALSALNAREAAAFAAQMRRTEADDEQMAREVRRTRDEGSTTSAVSEEGETN